jgi:hypothetical protein
MTPRLVGIYIVWYDGTEILPFSIRSIADVVDEVIIIYSNTSNHGTTINCLDQIDGLGSLVNWEPNLSKTPHQNEVDKRNYGLNVARALHYTHFIMLDCDECYDSEELKRDRDSIYNSEFMNGLVHPVKAYLTPTLCCDDHTFVPGIHKLKPEAKFLFNTRGYPFAYDNQGHAHIDPTRRLAYTSGIMMSGATMHHFSQVRKSLKLKLDNSSARDNWKKSSIFEDMENAKPGYFSKVYRQPLTEVPNKFGIVI